MDAGNDNELPPALAGGRSDRFYLLLLLALLLPLRGWLLYNTEVTARDSIGYIRYALSFEQMSWQDAVCAQVQHPGYAFCVWLASVPLRAWHGGIDPEIMQLSTQLVSALASLLLIVPMYYLGKTLLGPRVAFWGTLLFQMLPICGQNLSDGVSEPLYLLFLTTSLWQGVTALNVKREDRSGPEMRGLFFSGLFSGLAYLTRPEGAILVICASLALMLRQIAPSWRVGWTRFAAGGVCLAVPAAAAAGLYFMTTGEFTRKPTPLIVIGAQSATRTTDDDSDRCVAGTQGGALFASAFASFITPAQDQQTRLARGVRTVALEVMQAFHYFGVFIAAFGLLCFGGRLLRLAGSWMIVFLVLVQTTILLFLTVRVFYVSERHVMILVLPGCYLMAAGLLEAGRRMQAVLSKRTGWADARLSLSVVLLLAVIAVCVPKTAERLHRNREGNHQAGLWLKSELKDGDLVLDDHCWSHFYAGQVFLEGNEPLVDPDYRPNTYVVMTRSNVRDVDATRKAEEERLRNANADLVYQWPERGSVEKARVVVYRLPRDRDAYPWKVASRR